MSNVELYLGDCVEVMKRLPTGSIQTCITSPPYFGLRDYQVKGQIGLEPTVGEYVGAMVAVFREVWRVLADNATLWLNLGDSYATGQKGGVKCKEGDKNYTNKGSLNIPKVKVDNGGLPEKNLIGIPWRVAFALQDEGWILRSDIIWHKPNPMPESVTDRPTRAHEYIFLFSKQGKYYYDADAIKEKATYGDDDRKARAQDSHKSAPTDKVNGIRPHTDKQRGHGRRHAGFNERWDNMTKEEQCAGMRNKRDVWSVSPSQFAEAHFATFPPALIEPCVLAGSAVGDAVLDPFNGSGTTGIVSLKHKRRYVGIELNEDYFDMSMRRLSEANREAAGLPKQLVGNPVDYASLPMFAQEAA